MDHRLYNMIHTSWPMGCTPVRIVPIPHGTWIVQWCVQPWTMHCTMVGIPMNHRLYNTMHIPCTMGCTLVEIVETIHGPQVVQWYVQPWTMCCEMVCIPHVPWVAHQLKYVKFLVSHGLYNGMYTHLAWVVQWCRFPVHHGLYTRQYSTDSPWATGCTTAHLPHGTWVAQ